MIKKIALAIVVCFAVKGYAQEGTASPYSFYGIGSLKFKGTVENKSMGGLSIYTDSIHVNLRNPASYGGENLEYYNNETRPVKFTLGGGHTELGLEAENGNSKTTSTTFDYLALSVPVGKLGFGFGLMPYTSVGYKLENANEEGDPTNRYRGEGGVNKVFFSAGYQLTKSLSVGVDANYNFGNIKNSSVEFLYDGEGNIAQYQTRQDDRSDLSGLNLNFGLTYKAKIGDKLQLQSGLTYTPEARLTSKNQRSLSTITISATTGEELVRETIEQDLEASGLDETELVLPSKLAFGAGLGQPRKWFAGIEYSMMNTSNFSNALYDSNAGTTYQDGSTIAVGGFFIPEYDSFSSYLKRIVYRTGARFEDTGLMINGEAIKEFGISFGVGLPVGRTTAGRGPVFSNANIGVEFGQRGTTNNNLIQENFVNFNLSLSLNDRWFKKRKYN